MELSINKIIAFFLILGLTACKADRTDMVENVQTDSICKIQFYADFGQKEKSSIADQYGKIVWTAKDSISVFVTGSGEKGSKFITEEGGEVALFEGSAQGDAESYLGLYPCQAAAEENGQAGIIAVLPEMQKGVAGTYDPMAFLSVSEAENTEKMTFHNVCGGLRLKFEGESISSVEISGNNGEILAGKINIDVSNAPGYSIVGSEGKTKVTITADDVFQSGEYYYITLLPQELENGITMVYHYKGMDKTKSVKCPAFINIRRSTFTTINSADNIDVVSQIIEGKDISAKETANCYIISKPGYYKFRLVQGNGTNSVADANIARVIWETDNSNTKVANGSIISNAILRGSYIYICVPSDANTGRVKNGNALVGACTSSGLIKWSWHIWVCDGYNPQESAQTYLGSNAVMMDRNLGALSADAGNALSNGFMYQWGRKDPFPGSSSSSSTEPMAMTSEILTLKGNSLYGTVIKATQYPNMFICPDPENISNDWLYGARDNTLWQKEKTIYDPCPPGWKVPDGADGGPWEKAEYKVDSGNKGIYFSTGDGYKAWYPNNGFINTSGNLLMTGQQSYYWTYMVNTQFAWTLQIMMEPGKDAFVNPKCSGKVRGEGHSVRCTKDE